MLVKQCICAAFVTCLALTGNAVNAEMDRQINHSQRLKQWLIDNVNNHPSVLAAIAAVDASGYRLIAADKAIYNPELELGAVSAETDSAYVGISQDIDWGDTRGARTAMASSEKAAAQFEYESTRRSITVELLAGLADYHTTAALKQLSQQASNLLKRFSDVASQRYEAGDLSQVEVDLASLSYAEARFKLADAITSHAVARQNLISLTGGADQSWPVMDATLPDPAKVIQDADVTVRQLPEMRRVNSMVAAAQAKIKVRTGEAAADPTFAIIAGKEEEEGLFGLTFSVPLQIRNNFKAEVDVANSEMIKAEREAIDVYRKLKSRLESARVAYELSREAWLAWETVGEGSLKHHVELLERLWNAGELSTTDYLVQLTQALKTKAGAIEQRGKMWTAWSEWLVATGQIESWLQTGVQQ